MTSNMNGEPNKFWSASLGVRKPSDVGTVYVGAIEDDAARMGFICMKPCSAWSPNVGVTEEPLLDTFMGGCP